MRLRARGRKEQRMDLIKDLSKNWYILQDVHDTGEELGLYKTGDSWTTVGSQLSEWEPLRELKQLQLIFAGQPYFGRELRYFNQAPWWYKQEFEVKEQEIKTAVLRFTNVDYYCKVWLNGEYLGGHEGYSAPFSFDVGRYIRKGEKNLLVVKVSSPWDNEVECGEEGARTTLVRRRMVKGTYEHSDTFVQRDVNPVGIYGRVELVLAERERIGEKPFITYHLNRELASARVKAEVFLTGLVPGQGYRLDFLVRDKNSGILKMENRIEFIAECDKEEGECYGVVEDVRLWNTWDHGNPWLYQAEVKLFAEGELVSRQSEVLAFREVTLDRTKDKTCFILNRKRFFIRGTSYFPDNYVSAVSEERYWRDLLNIKAAGFNLVRVHVHVEQEVFYRLCDELGIAVIQDSEYNWTHPSNDEWADKFIGIYKENIRMLMPHPSIICWIGMNEPGCIDPDGKTRRRFMEENPGPKLYEEIRKLDPGRPIIKGSFCNEDLFSGDSHNYLGSLSGGEYKDIYGTAEKLNTEYGFDAPAGMDNLKKIPEVYRRLSALEDNITEIQEYQYKLLKYYTEHYRMQKYAPCSGYIQFMFIDLCPQSFYGIYDWWGIPKKGLQAMLESNRPVGIFAKYKDKLDAVYVVNDTEDAFRNCTVQWALTIAETGEVVKQGRKIISIEEDSIVQAEAFDYKWEENVKYNLTLMLDSEAGFMIARNSYKDISFLPGRVPGHPDRMSHEFGMRLYWA